MSHLYHPYKRKNIAEIWSSEAWSILMFTFPCSAAFKKTKTIQLLLPFYLMLGEPLRITFLEIDVCYSVSAEWVILAQGRGSKLYGLHCTIPSLFLQDCVLKPATLEIHDSHSLITYLMVSVDWEVWPPVCFLEILMWVIRGEGSCFLLMVLGM